MIAPPRWSPVGIDLHRAGAYILSRQTSDGGFFFARVPPGTARDTYCALSSLKLLGLEPVDPGSVVAWVQDAGASEHMAHPSTIYYLVGAARCLGLPRPTWASWASRIERFANERGGYGAWTDLDIEVTSELETSFFAVEVLAAAEALQGSQRLREFVRDHENDDGGFGRHGCSTLASTFYALSILRRLGEPPDALRRAGEWLRAREAHADVQFMEDVYWLIGGLHCLGQEPAEPQRFLRFLGASHRPSGGFSRSTYGIANLEYTLMALRLLRWLEDAPAGRNG